MCFNFIRLGLEVDSWAEHVKAAASVRNATFGEQNRERFSVFKQVFDQALEEGVQSGGLWISTEKADVFIFTGRHQNEEPVQTRWARLWVAIEVDGNARPNTLLMMRDGYFGDESVFQDFLVDALERYERGERVAWPS